MHQVSVATKPKLVRLGSNGPTTGTANSGEVHFAIMHASNLGTSEALAGLHANSAVERGLDIKFIKTASSVVDELPRDLPVVIITASYNGEPSRDATDFMS